MREVFVGFDSAWADNPRSPGAIAIAEFTAGVLTDFKPPQLVSFAQAAELVDAEGARGGFVLVALDQPTIVPNQKGFRPAELVACAVVNGLKGGVQAGCRSKDTMFGDAAPIWRFKQRLGAAENPEVARAADGGTHLIEVFPALALPSLVPLVGERKRALKYNPKVRRQFARSDWDVLARTVGEMADGFGLTPLSQWAQERLEKPKPTKSDQDELDAAVCLLIALAWRRWPRDRMMVIGNGREGFIVTPVVAWTRAKLEASALKRGVAIDKGWHA